MEKWIKIYGQDNHKPNLPPFNGTGKKGEGRFTYQESIKVLCAVHQKSGKRFVTTGFVRVYDSGSIRWMIPGTIDLVTHWMYLPELPELKHNF